MSSLQAYNDLARALHHARYGDALQLVDRLLAAQPESTSLRRQREACLVAIERAEVAAREEAEQAARFTASELIRVEASLFDLDQQMFCNAPVSGLHALGFTWLLDAASTAFSRRGDAPALIRFSADEDCATLVVCFSARMGTRPVRLLACVSEFSDGSHLLTHRDDELVLASGARIEVMSLPRAASLTELVARHAGRVAMRTRDSAVATVPLSTLSACDRIWRLIAGT